LNEKLDDIEGVVGVVAGVWLNEKLDDVEGVVLNEKLGVAKVAPNNDAVDGVDEVVNEGVDKKFTPLPVGAVICVEVGCWDVNLVSEVEEEEVVAWSGKTGDAVKLGKDEGAKLPNVKLEAAVLKGIIGVTPWGAPNSNPLGDTGLGDLGFLTGVICFCCGCCGDLTSDCFLADR
jgi:hypothetical protein